ncbi:hypothetical protein [Streptomyces sp. NPDC004721]
MSFFLVLVGVGVGGQVAAGSWVSLFQLVVNAVAQGQVRCDAQVAAAGVAGQAGGQVVEAEAHGVGFGACQVLAVVQGQQPEPGIKIGREVRGKRPADVDLPRL